jgi:hypothetical protein
LWNKDENKKDEKNKSNELENYFYLNNGNNSIYKTFQFLIEGEYKICVYGAKALEGGKGGVQCAEHFFEKNDKLEFYLEGRKSGGKGGVNCSKIETKNGYDGAGLAKVIRLNYSDFVLVAGGGGGSCESGNKGGDYERDGEDEKGGKGATNTSGGEKGDWDATDGTQYRGGNGGRTDRDDKFLEEEMDILVGVEEAMEVKFIVEVEVVDLIFVRQIFVILHISIMKKTIQDIKYSRKMIRTIEKIFIK